MNRLITLRYQLRTNYNTMRKTDENVPTGRQVEWSVPEAASVLARCEPIEIVASFT